MRLSAAGPTTCRSEPFGKREIAPVWFGRYLQFDDLRPDDILTVEFPMVERTEQYLIQGTLCGDWSRRPGNVSVSCRFRSNTVVEITPALLPGSPLYQRRPEKYKIGKAPTKKVIRYATRLVLKW